MTDRNLNVTFPIKVKHYVGHAIRVGSRVFGSDLWRSGVLVVLFKN
jgi:hypothetical protein